MPQWETNASMLEKCICTCTCILLNGFLLHVSDIQFLFLIIIIKASTTLREYLWHTGIQRCIMYMGWSSDCFPCHKGIYRVPVGYMYGHQEGLLPGVMNGKYIDQGNVRTTWFHHRHLAIDECYTPGFHH